MLDHLTRQHNSSVVRALVSAHYHIQGRVSSTVHIVVHWCGSNLHSELVFRISRLLLTLERCVSTDVRTGTEAPIPTEINLSHENYMENSLAGSVYYHVFVEGIRGVPCIGRQDNSRETCALEGFRPNGLETAVRLESDFGERLAARESTLLDALNRRGNSELLNSHVVETVRANSSEAWIQLDVC